MEKVNSKDPGLPKNKQFCPKTKNAECGWTLAVFPPLIVLLISYCIYCSWSSGIQSMTQFYFTDAHLEFFKGRSLIFSKTRKICIKDKLKLLQNTIKLNFIPNIS